MKAAFARLQNQPHAVRSRTALMMAVILTALIGLAVLSTIPFRFADLGENPAGANAAAALSATGETANEQLQSVKDSWSSITSGVQAAQSAAAINAAASGDAPQTTLQTTNDGTSDQSAGTPQDANFPQDGASTINQTY